MTRAGPLSLCALAMLVAATGCASRQPVQTPAQLRGDPARFVGTAELPISYQRAADCFENTAARISIDGENSTNLTVLPELSTARITVTSYGLVYAVMDLVGTSATSSKATAFAVEPFQSDHVQTWLKTLRDCR